MTDTRNFVITGTVAGKHQISVRGVIAEDETVSAASARYFGLAGDAPALIAVKVSGEAKIQPDGTEALTLISEDAATFDVSISATIAADGLIVAATINATIPDAVTIPDAAGAAAARIITYAMGIEAEDRGATVFDGIPVSDPCALALKLEAARLELIAGERASRVTLPGGQDVTFTAGNLTALTAEIQRQRAACEAKTGNVSRVSDRPRTRRLIRFNPH
jgi:hypothetical protein